MVYRIIEFTATDTGAPVTAPGQFEQFQLCANPDRFTPTSRTAQRLFDKSMSCQLFLSLQSGYAGCQHPGFRYFNATFKYLSGADNRGMEGFRFIFIGQSDPPDSESDARMHFQRYRHAS